MEHVKYIIYIILILLIFYFAYSSNKKQNDKIRKMQSELKKGDKIITYSGFSGVIKEVLEDRVILETNPSKVEISIEKWAVAGFDDREII